MLGIIILLAVFLVLGFIFAWIAGIVAKEEVEIKTGMIILFLTAVATILLGLALPPEEETLRMVGIPAVQLGMITILTRLLTGISIVKSFIIAVVYAVVLTVVALVLAQMASQ